MRPSEHLNNVEIVANATVFGTLPEPREAELMMSIDQVRIKVEYEDVSA